MPSTVAPADWADCSSALAPNPQWPQQVCQVAKDEVHYWGRSVWYTLTDLAPASAGAGTQTVVNGLAWLVAGKPSLSLNAYAELAAPACTPDFADALRAGQLPKPVRRSASQQALLIARAPVAMAKGLLMDQADFRLVTRMVADREAVRMAGRTWLWWHAQLQRDGASSPWAAASRRGDEAALNAMLDARPADLQLAGHPLRVVRKGDALTLELPLWRQPRKTDAETQAVVAMALPLPVVADNKK